MSVDFEPVRLGPGRRRIEPVVIGLVALVVDVAFAVVKPWESADRTAPSVPVAAASVEPGPAASPSPRPTRQRVLLGTAIDAPRSPTWAEISPVVTRHDAWGIRAIVVDATAAGPGHYAERWFPAAADQAGIRSVTVDGGEAIVALGPTSPSDVDLLDARIWLVHAGDSPGWVDASPVGPRRSSGAFLYERGDRVADAPSPWDPGRYRLDVLTGDEIQRIGVGIPGRLGVVPAATDVPTPTAPEQVLAAGSDPSGVHAGLFATADGSAISLPALGGVLQDDHGAWLDLVLGSGPLGESVIASVYQPRATGLGVMLTPHAIVASATVHRLAPDGRFDSPSVAGGISSTQGRTPYVVFQAPGDSVWPPGVYAVSVSWTDAAGQHDDTWHVELRPGSDISRS